jgi:hypothetical protein
MFDTQSIQPHSNGGMMTQAEFDATLKAARALIQQARKDPDSPLARFWLNKAAELTTNAAQSREK